MRIYHNSRDSSCRTPFGAIEIERTLTLSLFVYDQTNINCRLRIWIDTEGETIMPMTLIHKEDHLCFTCELTSKKPNIIWYSFIITYPSGDSIFYGPRLNHVGGEGMIYHSHPSSFQITVYKKRIVPDWYKKGIVYQIFPDSFHRGSDFAQNAKFVSDQKRNGIPKNILYKWDTLQGYDKNDQGEINVWNFYGGTLAGIQEKLPYLKNIGITILYLNPIFEAASPHRYDTGNYMKIDPLLGNEDSLRNLINSAQDHGINIILDGVFNHTGSDSMYFNKYGNYPTIGAFQSTESPYYDWFHFDDSSIGYDCWWGVDDLPNINEETTSYRDFIFNDKDSVICKYLNMNIKGWRLDVADEMPDDFIVDLKKAMIDTQIDSVLLGEVWEDASNKISYGKLRRYLLDDELDSTMNYPFRDSLINYLLGKINAYQIQEQLVSLQENYPEEAFYAALNLLGSHDRARILTLLGEAPTEDLLVSQDKANYRLNPDQRNLAKTRLWLALIVQMTLPGVPSIYYGDEAGMEGYSDPYNREAYPWGKTDLDTQTMVRNAIGLRRSNPIFIDGSFTALAYDDDIFGYYRELDDEKALTLINRSTTDTKQVTFDREDKIPVELLNNTKIDLNDQSATITLSPLSAYVIFFPKKIRLALSMPDGLGVLCHITSLPNQAKPGKLLEPATRFIDLLAAANQKYWQILPLNPVDQYNSPYASTSVFAGNLELLPDDMTTLKHKFKTFIEDNDYTQFIQANNEWLNPYACFTILSDHFNNSKWQTWPMPYRTYSESLLQDKHIQAKLPFVYYCQYEFHRLWSELKKYASVHDIKIIGDIPFYVSEQSADVWANPELFMLNEDGSLASVAGVPPDYFAEEGQLWGNPIYNWDAMAKDKWQWWIARFKRAMNLYDFVRLDHFIGFESFWSIPNNSKAKDGAWSFSVGFSLFAEAYKQLGPLPFIAEDLGVITPAVRSLMAQTGFFGLDIIQFSYQNDYVALRHKIVCSGTHDNQTLYSWCLATFPELEPSKLADHILEMLCRSRAPIVIIPLQDILMLDDDSRMNTPGTTIGNWLWQANEKTFDLETIEKLRSLAKIHQESLVK